MRLLLSLLLSLYCVTLAAQDIEVKMLAQNSALLVIDGKQRMLRVGATSPEGVKLMSANSTQAVVEVNGKRETLTMSRRISTQFTKADRAEIRLASVAGGHYMAPGRINGLPVQFMVDTGATYIAMNYHEAERLGLDYLAGQPLTMSTANGLAHAYLVTLNRVKVGDIEIDQVQATVHDGDSPTMMLLGNSFLSKVDIRIDQGVMVLRAKH